LQQRSIATEIISTMTTEPKRVLIIDDEKEICSLLTECFTEGGYAVEVAYDGEDGIVKAKSFGPDIIILDHRMPTMGGSQVIRMVREFCDTPIICVSAINDQSAIDECLKLGASEYMFKPINLEELERAIESALKEK